MKLLTKEINKQVIVFEDRLDNIKYIEEHVGPVTARVVGSGRLDLEYFYIDEYKSQVENYNASAHRLWEEAYLYKVPYYLHFEDDVKFLSAWPETIDVPDDWDLLYLAVNPKSPPIKIREDLVKLTSGHSFSSVIVRDTMYRRLASLPINHPLDVCVSYTHKHINAYAVYPSICGQHAGFSRYCGLEVPEKRYEYEVCN